jgi:hypothetical protein
LGSPVSSPPQSNSTFEVFAVASGVGSIALTWIFRRAYDHRSGELDAL